VYHRKAAFWCAFCLEIATMIEKISLMTKTLNGGAEVPETTVKKASMLRLSTHW
jgi:hypothetical protein